MHRIDLNCDMGESFGAWNMGADEAVMPCISSANIACGFHAGDASVMRRTVAAAVAADVAIGAHVGLPDLAGFGRRRMALDPQAAYDITVVQIGALAAVAHTQGARLRHVKPHGALYHMLDEDSALAEATARAIRDVDARLYVFGRSQGPWLRMAASMGLEVCHEVFADRTYRDDGTLMPRSEPGASLHGMEAVTSQAVRLAQGQGVVTGTGKMLSLKADTLCIHGDRDDAGTLAQTLRRHLESAGIRIARHEPG